MARVVTVSLDPAGDPLNGGNIWLPDGVPVDVRGVSSVLVGPDAPTGLQIKLGDGEWMDAPHGVALPTLGRSTGRFRLWPALSGSPPPSSDPAGDAQHTGDVSQQTLGDLLRARSFRVWLDLATAPLPRPAPLARVNAWTIPAATAAWVLLDELVSDSDDWHLLFTVRAIDIGPGKFAPGDLAPTYEAALAELAGALYGFDYELFSGCDAAGTADWTIQRMISGRAMRRPLLYLNNQHPSQSITVELRHGRRRDAVSMRANAAYSVAYTASGSIAGVKVTEFDRRPVRAKFLARVSNYTSGYLGAFLDFTQATSTAYSLWSNYLAANGVINQDVPYTTEAVAVFSHFGTDPTYSVSPKPTLMLYAEDEP